MATLPERASLEYLKKAAKERLARLRSTKPASKLSDAQLAIAREYGFPSWRALKAEVDRRRASPVAAFFKAAANGDVDTLRALLKESPSLVHEREPGDNATPLHLAAANKHLESVRILLDAGADVHGRGDLHDGDVIGWATCDGNEAVLDLLLERGARHHIYSAMALRDLDLVRRIVEDDPASLRRRRSRFENSQTPVHASFAAPDGVGVLSGQPNYEMLQLLIDLGADLGATDDKGRTPLEVAMLHGDREAMRILRAAGAKDPASGRGRRSAAPDDRQAMAAAAHSITKSVPLFWVPDMRATLRWYESVGFTVNDTYEENGEVMFASLSFGKGELAFTPGARQGPTGLSFWFFTERIAELYALLKERQLRAAEKAMAGDTDEPEVRFDQDLHEPFYGGRQFDIRDNNGLSLVFFQPLGETAE